MAGYKIVECSKCRKELYYNYSLDNVECPECEEKTGQLIDGEERCAGFHPFILTGITDGRGLRVKDPGNKGD